MPKKAYLANYYSSEELKHKYLKCQDAVESRRWHLLGKISLGWTIKNSAIAVGMNYDYAKEIIKKYNCLGAKGLENLKNKQPQQLRGKKALLTDYQLEKLRQELASRPLDGGIWTGPKVARWIEKRNSGGKSLASKGMGLLKKLKYSWQSPRPKQRKGSQQEQEQFIQNLPLKVKNLEANYPEAQIELGFFDEHRVGLKPILRKVWHQVGSRPIAVVSHRYETIEELEEVLVLRCNVLRK